MGEKEMAAIFQKCPDCGKVDDHHLNDDVPNDPELHYKEIGGRYVSYRERGKKCNGCAFPFTTVEMPIDDFLYIVNEYNKAQNGIADFVRSGMERRKREEPKKRELVLGFQEYNTSFSALHESFRKIIGSVDTDLLSEIPALLKAEQSGAERVVDASTNEAGA